LWRRAQLRGLLPIGGAEYKSGVFCEHLLLHGWTLPEGLDHVLAELSVGPAGLNQGFITGVQRANMWGAFRCEAVSNCHESHVPIYLLGD
jgi:hypothetical protein